jgi:peptidoglycan/LPS O-acetylase OafA/YrhL
MTVLESPGSAQPIPRDGERLPVLDGLRGAAMCLVLWHHVVEFQLPLGKESWLGWLRSAGNLSWSGSDLFLVVSGFLAGRALLASSSRRATLAYLIRRTLRIVPHYLVVLTIVYAAGTTLSPAVHIRQPFWSYATFSANFALALANTWDWIALSVYWFIAVALQFSLAASLIVYLRRSIVPTAALATIAATQLLRWLFYAIDPQATVAQYVLPFLRMDTFAWGLLVAWLAGESHGQWAMQGLRRHAPLLLGLAAVILLGLSALRPRQGEAALVHGGYAAIAFAYAVIVGVAIARLPELLRGVLTSRPLRWLGRRTYGIYLWHAAISWAVFHFVGGPHFVIDSWRAMAVVMLALACTLSLAELGWRWLEAPLFRTTRRYSNVCS